MIELIEVLKAVLFGIVEGVTEWLPISSTGHLILLNEVVKLKVSDEFYSMFEVVIQLGRFLQSLFYSGVRSGRLEEKITWHLWQNGDRAHGSKQIFLNCGFIFWFLSFRQR